MPPDKFDQSLREAVVTGPVSDRRTDDIGVQSLLNIAMHGLFCSYLGLMVVRVSTKGSFNSRWHGRGDRPVNADRATMDELLHSVLMRLTKQECRPFNIHPPEVGR
jgi:hypothetical protein